jgi:hypothetical protein
MMLLSTHRPSILQEKFRRDEYISYGCAFFMRIFIVEDDPKMSIVLRDALEKRAHRIVLTASGKRSAHDTLMMLLAAVQDFANGLPFATMSD